MLPLIRLRIEHGMEWNTKLNTSYLTREFKDHVANPGELIRFVSRNQSYVDGDGDKFISDEYISIMEENDGTDDQNFNMDNMMAILNDGVVKESIQLTKIMSDYFADGDDNGKDFHFESINRPKLNFFSYQYLTNKIVNIVGKDTVDEFGVLVEKYQQIFRKMLPDMTGKYDRREIDEEIQKVKFEIEKNPELLNNGENVGESEVKKNKININTKKQKKKLSDFFKSDDNDLENDEYDLVLDKKRKNRIKTKKQKTLQ